jgi:hypothetical protein
MQMTVDEDTEKVAPTQVIEGDVIEDQLGKRRLAVREITVGSGSQGGVYSFYGEGPEDRITFEATESVRRRKH